MADPDHLKILNRGVEVWNKWRKENPDIIPDLCDAGLNEADIRGADFHNADLLRAYLSEVYLRETHLEGADIRDADLSGADLTGAQFRDANLSGADLNDANLSNANLSNVQLLNASLKEANLSGADLSEANLSEANLSGANLSGTRLIGANLYMAKLYEVDLRGANLTNADLTNADLGGSCLTDADLRDADFEEVNLSGTDLCGTIFTSEGKPKGRGSFLDLASCIGLEAAIFSEPGFLQDYLIRAFEYAHRSDTFEAENWPEFLERSIKKIRNLRSLYADQLLPRQLIDVVSVITSELINYLKKHPKALYQIKSRQFEELIAEILASYGWQVQLTPPIKDGGYDIFAISKDIQADVETSWIIECKKYAPQNKVEVDIVRALYGVKSDLKVANALLATTSYFTKGVKDFKASRYDIELKDYYNILEWINQYRPNPDGKLYIKNNRLIIPNED